MICADGTWNRPEKDLAEDFPTNVLRLARAIKPVADDGLPQQVLYDWGIGSYYDSAVGGATGRGLHKNIMDDTGGITVRIDAGAASGRRPDEIGNGNTAYFQAQLL